MGDSSRAGFTTVGVDVGGTSVKYGLVAHAGDGGPPTVGSIRRFETRAYRSPQEVIADIAAAARGLSDEARSSDVQVAAIGIGVPAVLNREGGIGSLPNFGPGWEGISVHAEIERATGIPTVIANDARAFTLAEATAGAGRGSRAVLGVTLGTGVGGGLFLDGELYLGPSGNAGELGHHVVDPAGPRCGCGSYGCLETFASATAVVGAVTRPFLQGAAPALRKLADGRLEAVTAELVVEAARSGDHACSDALARAGMFLGVAIANAATLVAIETVVIGGGLANAGDAIFDPLRLNLARHTAVLGDGAPAVELATLGAAAGVLGTGVYAARRLLESA